MAKQCAVLRPSKANRSRYCPNHQLLDVGPGGRKDSLRARKLSLVVPSLFADPYDTVSSINQPRYSPILSGICPFGNLTSTSPIIKGVVASASSHFPL